MKSRNFLLLAMALMMGFRLSAQEEKIDTLQMLTQRTAALEESVGKLKNFKVSGYIQAQYQLAQPDAGLNTNMKVGGTNGNVYERDNYSRIGVRRGRIKFTYEEGIASGVFQLDITEKGVGVKDVYLNIKDPWIKSSSLRAGVFDRTFGYEIAYSSSRRESPERSTIFQTLFPDERDLGAALFLQTAKTSPINFLHLDAGMFSGNGIKLEMDNRLDFIGHLNATNNIGAKGKYGLGVSYYNGGVIQGSKNIYDMKNGAFVIDSTDSNFKKYAKREYFGVDGQISFISKAGMTKLNAEYLFGQQPGIKGSSKSPNTGVLLTGIKEMDPGLTVNDTYIRNFQGGYVMLAQDLGALPFTIVLKYDWYDPNTKVSGKNIGKSTNTGFADLMQSTIGFGAFWRATNSIRLTAYYEINSYEKTDLEYSYTYNSEKKTFDIGDLKRNVFTLRLQYKF